MLSGVGQLAAQTLTLTNPPSYGACAETDTLFISLSLSATSTQVYEGALEITFPAGVVYVDGSGVVSSSTIASSFDVSGIDFYATSSGMGIDFNDDILTPGTLNMYVLKQAQCASGPQQDVAELFYYTSPSDPVGTSTSVSATSNYSIVSPEVQIQSINPTPQAVALGTPFTRTFTIVNDNSLGATVDNFFLTNFTGNGLELVGVTGGTLNPTQDTIFVDASDFGSAPGGSIPDRLEGGETYSLQVTQVAQTCEDLSSQMQVGWLCGGTVCGTNVRNESVVLAAGDPLLTYTFERFNQVGPCQDGRVSVTIKNTGENMSNATDTAAAAAYDLNVRLGRWRWWQAGLNGVLAQIPAVDYYLLPNTLTDPRDNQIRIRLYDFQIDGTPVDTLPTTVGNRNEGYILDLSSLPGPLMGLQDLDGDGDYDDLAVGDSITIDLLIDIPCLEDCPGIDNELTDLDFYRLLAYTEIRDVPCEGATAGTPGDPSDDYQDSVFWSFGDNTGNDYEIFTMFQFEDRYDNAPVSYFPSSTMNDEDTVTVSICFDRRRNNIDCPEDSLYLILDEQPGYQVLDEFDRCTGVAAGLIDFDRTTVPGRIVMTQPNYRFITPGDTTVHLEDQCFTFDLRLNCDVPGFDENDPVNYEIYYDCAGATCPCIQPFECGALNLVTNCPGGCTEGAQLFEMRLQRNTFGWVENYNPTTGDLDYIPVYPPLPDSLSCQFRLDRAMPYDTVLVTAQTVVRTSGTGYDNMYFELDHTAGVNIFADSIREVSVTHTSFSSGVTTTINLPLSRTSSASSGNGIRLEFLAGQDGFPANFENLDEFDIELFLVVAKNDAYLSYIPAPVTGLQGYAYSNDGSDNLSCDTVLSAFELHRPYYGGVNVGAWNYNPGVSGLTPEGANVNWGQGIEISDCDDYRIQPQLFLNDHEYARYYPGEFRPWFGVDSLLIKTRANRYLYELSSGRYRTWNHQDVEGNNQYDFVQYEVGSGNTPRPSSLPDFPSPTITTVGDTMKVAFDGSNWHLAEVTSNDEGERFFFDAIIASDACHFPESVGEEVRVEWHLSNYAYARHPEAASEQHIAIDQEEAFISKQPLSINLPGGSQDEAFSPFESFTFSVCNDNPNNAAGAANGGELPAENVWFALISPTEDILIESVTRVSDGVTMSVTTYDAGHYWVQAGDFAYNECQEFRVNYDYTSCTDQELAIEAAWDCQVPSSPNDPRALQCNIIRDTLDIIIQPSQLQGAIIQTDSAWICDTLTYYLRITNANLQYTRSLEATVNPAPGMTFIPDSSSLLYPVPGGTDFEDESLYTSIPDPVGNTWDLNAIWPSTPGLNEHELPGTTETDSNTVYIRFRMALSCDYIVGAQPTFEINGVRHCGDPISTGVITAPVPRIRGNIEAYGANLDINSGANIEIDGCGSSATATITLTNSTGPGSSAEGDSIFVVMPAGFEYIGGSYDGVSNASPDGTAPVVLGTAGNDTLGWAVPSGLGIGESMVFRFGIRATPAAACGTNIPIRLYSTTIQGLFCPYNNTICEVFIVTASNTALLDHEKPRLSINMTASTISGNTLNVAGLIENGSTVSTAENISPYDQTTVRFYCDDNPENGDLDAGEALLGTYNVTTAIPGTGSHGFSQSFTINPADCPGDGTEAPSLAMVHVTQEGNPAVIENCVCNEFAARRMILLPVTWLWVNGEAAGAANRIMWRVLEDGRTQTYEIERHLKDEDRWEKIGEVTALQLRNETHRYEWMHQNPLPEELYRIRGIDYEGKDAYSNAFAVFNRSARTQWEVFPNPADDLIQVINVNQPTTYRIVDLLGKQLLAGEIAPATNHRIPVQHLPNGKYILILERSDSILHESVVIQH